MPMPRRAAALLLAVVERIDHAALKELPQMSEHEKLVKECAKLIATHHRRSHESLARRVLAHVEKRLGEHMAGTGSGHFLDRISRMNATDWLVASPLNPGAAEADKEA
jgi:hypothetical protein